MKRPLAIIPRTMKSRFNWRLWTGLLLAIVAFISYFAFFAGFELTRDVPWTAFILFAFAAALLISGWRRAPRKVVPSIVAVLALLVVGFFTYSVTAGSGGLPSSSGAPAVGAKAPDFSLPDTNGRTVRLSDVLSRSNGVVLVFYRGHW
jgi:peptidoglycan/LPS O-acetylase OafA/YrhL